MRIADDPIAELIPHIRVAGDFTVKGYVLGPREIPDYEIVFFPYGTKTTYITGGTTLLIDRPCIIITRTREEHSYRFDPNRKTRHLFVHFEINENALSANTPTILLPNGPFYHFLQQDFMVPNLLKHILYMAHEQPPRWEQRISRMLFTVIEELEGAILSEMSSVSRTIPPQPIIRALEYIDNHLHEPLSVETLVKLSGWSHEHFTRTFVQAVGVPPRTEVLRRRIEKACVLLQNPEHSIKQIAYQMGFENPSYFYRVFRKLRGVTAAEFRRTFADRRFAYLQPPDLDDTLYPVNRMLLMPGRKHIK